MDKEYILVQVLIPKVTFCDLNTVKPPNKGHIEDAGHLSLVERLSSSQRFSFKPSGNPKKLEHLKAFKCIAYVFILMFFQLQDGKSNTSTCTKV